MLMKRLIPIVLTIGIGVILTMSSCSQKQENKRVAMSGVAGEKGEEAQVMTSRSFGEQVSVMRKFFFEKGEKFPLAPLPQEKTDIQELIADKGAGLKVSWLGHSSLLINIDGYILLTDPVFQRKVSPVGPTRFEGGLPLEIADLPDLDAVIISHDHYDHLNKFSVQRLKEKTSTFVVPLRVGKRLVEWGIPEDRIVELDWWMDTSPKPGLAITATPSKHFSGRGLFDRNKTLWASWVIRTQNHRVFFSGDSGYFDGFKAIGEKYGPFDAAFIECGAYNENWADVHMFPEQTARAAVDLKASVLQPIHWATFNLALHAWYEPVERLLLETEKHGLVVSTPKIGQVVDYHEPVVAGKWWLEHMEMSKQRARQKQGDDVLVGQAEPETMMGK